MSLMIRIDTRKKNIKRVIYGMIILTAVTIIKGHVIDKLNSFDFNILRSIQEQFIRIEADLDRRLIILMSQQSIYN